MFLLCVIVLTVFIFPSISFVRSQRHPSGLKRKFTLSSGVDELQPEILLEINTKELVDQGKLDEWCRDMYFQFTNEFSQTYNVPWYLEYGCNREYTSVFISIQDILENHHQQYSQPLMRLDLIWVYNEQVDDHNQAKFENSSFVFIASEGASGCPNGSEYLSQMEDQYIFIGEPESEPTESAHDHEIVFSTGSFVMVPVHQIGECLFSTSGCSYYASNHRHEFSFRSDGNDPGFDVPHVPVRLCESKGFLGTFLRSSTIFANNTQSIELLRANNWTAASDQFEGAYLKGSGTPDDVFIRYDSTHSHTAPYQNTGGPEHQYDRPSRDDWGGSQGNYVSNEGHTHEVSATVSLLDESCNPPAMTLTFWQADVEEPTPFAGMMMFSKSDNDNVPFGWEIVDSFDGYYARGSVDSFGKAILSSHSHNPSTTPSVLATTEYRFSDENGAHGSKSGLAHTHSHSLSVNIGESSVCEPKSMALRILRRIDSSRVNIEWEDEEDYDQICFGINSMVSSGEACGGFFCASNDNCLCDRVKSSIDGEVEMVNTTEEGESFGRECEEWVEKPAYYDSKKSILIRYNISVESLLAFDSKKEMVDEFDCDRVIDMEALAQTMKNGKEKGARCKWQPRDLFEMGGLMVRFTQSHEPNYTDSVTIKSVTKPGVEIRFPPDPPKEKENNGNNNNDWLPYLYNIGIPIVSVVAVCCVVGIVLFLVVLLRMTLQKKKLDKFAKIENVDLILEEQNLGDTPSAASLKMNPELFEINYEDIEVQEKLGSGGSDTIIMRCVWQNKECAYKAFLVRQTYQKDDFFEVFERELSVISSLAHPNLIAFFGATLKMPVTNFTFFDN